MLAPNELRCLRESEGIEANKFVGFDEPIVNFDYPIWSEDFYLFDFVSTQYTKSFGRDANTVAIEALLKNHAEFLKKDYQFSMDARAQFGIDIIPTMKHMLSAPISLDSGTQFKSLASAYYIPLNDCVGIFNKLPYLMLEFDERKTRWKQVWLVDPMQPQKEPEAMLIQEGQPKD